MGTEHYVPDSQLNPTDPAAASTVQQAYIGNVNSKKFHLPTCPNLPAEKNQILFSSYDEAIAAGYTPYSLSQTLRVCQLPLRWSLLTEPGCFLLKAERFRTVKAPSPRGLARREP